ncbi:hypothetical protein GGR28_001525 [Lewinella aquimaris]|uniref:Ig-like domain-containing protein n=1 Tax=Neolewinella aquimaris TaxID=1835722 RepID=A0A840EA54_9BACT|nr:Sb-PDE family phosphodiesterase [Neolewinella aquimaris]MBB4078908.1 hypothetical protein [Neolewinella aquimaris]
MRKWLLFLGIAVCTLPVVAQHGHGHSHIGERAIQFPDSENYLTLVCDFHQHTVFSDGSVWPDIRVQESLRDSVDAIAMTEHLEYQPHSDDIPHPDRNRSHQLAEEYARPYDMIVIPGAEITRDMPPGHVNALFIQDANKLLVNDSLAVFAEANRQGAFTFWNHPNWVAQREDGVARLTPFHRDLIDRKWLHGIEVVNDLTISKEALQIALDHDLTIMGTSDIHGLIDYQYDVAEGGHRPVTLVLCTERSAASIREALDAGRTVAWFENTLVGREANVREVVMASLSVRSAFYRGPSSIVDVTIRNDSDADYIIENLSGYSLQSGLGVLHLAPHAETTLSIMTGERVASFDLPLRILNAVITPEERLEINLPVTTE